MQHTHTLSPSFPLPPFLFPLFLPFAQDLDARELVAARTLTGTLLTILILVKACGELLSVDTIVVADTTEGRNIILYIVQMVKKKKSRLSSASRSTMRKTLCPLGSGGRHYAAD